MTSPEAPIASSVISDCMDRTGAMQGRIRSLTGLSVVGGAFTVAVKPGENATLHRAVYQAPPGTVLVIDAGGYPDRAVWGEVLTVAAQERGIIGVVLDGAVRDIEALRARAFPTFAVGACPAGPHKSPAGIIGGTISCGGVTVRSGDLVVADLDGVTVVPAGAVGRVLAAAQGRQRMESEWISAIEAGASTLDLLGLDGQER